MSVNADSEFEVVLPPWAQVKKGRRKHIVRVTRLLAQWADAMSLETDERDAWIDAGRYHDALRDAPLEELRALAQSTITEPELLHGPAAANYLVAQGEKRPSVLNAIRYHSIGSKDWDRVGRALYMADYLEPGRDFDIERRARLALQVPTAFDETFRDVVRSRMAYAAEQGFTEYPESIALLESVE
jgi:2-amino-4-hydroxy-6-hydroxymethyldihydropteridine diphosphokinase